MIFAVEAAAEGGNICADTIQAFLPPSLHHRGIVGRWKKQGGYVSGNICHRATFEQTKNCQHGINCRSKSTKIWCESPLDMPNLWTSFIIAKTPLEHVTIVS